VAERVGFEPKVRFVVPVNYTSYVAKNTGVARNAVDHCTLLHAERPESATDTTSFDSPTAAHSCV